MYVVLPIIFRYNANIPATPTNKAGVSIGGRKGQAKHTPLSSTYRPTTSGTTTRSNSAKSRHINWLLLPMGRREAIMQTRDPPQQMEMAAKNGCRSAEALSRGRSPAELAGS